MPPLRPWTEARLAELLVVVVVLFLMFLVVTILL